MDPAAMTGKGSIRPHVARDGTRTWQVRVDRRNPDTRRPYPPRSFATQREAQAALKLWLVDLACQAKPQQRAHRPYEVYLACALPPVFAPTVYFVVADASHAIKIGYSKHVPRRVQELQLASADTLRLVGMQRGDHTCERALHKRFAALHLRGEWYAAAKPLLSYIGKHASSPWDYYWDLCPQHARTVLRAYPDVFGSSEEDWCRPMF